MGDKEDMARDIKNKGRMIYEKDKESAKSSDI